jgi:thymidine kinase
MAKLYFYYSAMNAGKSTTLLQSAYNYEERGMKVLLFTPDFDNRAKEGTIASRIGLVASAVMFDSHFDFFKYISSQEKPHCVLIDESQFLNKTQVIQLGKVADELKIPVLCYGLRTDFQGELFEGSRYLLALADELSEIKTICYCGKKATMVLRLNDKGDVVREGSQILIGGNDRYISVCRKHFTEGIYR